MPRARMPAARRYASAPATNNRRPPKRSTRLPATNAAGIWTTAEAPITRPISGSGTPDRASASGSDAVKPWKPPCTANIETARSHSIRAFDHVHHGGVTSRAPFVLAVAQPQIVSFDIAANSATHADAVRAAAARVVVFPELSLTGYELDAPALAPADPRLAPIVDACAAPGSTALGGAPVAGEDGGRSIGMLAIDGSGVAVAYRKVWLGGAEPEHVRPGRGPAVLEVDGWRLGLAICKDTGVPAHAAATAALGMDAYVAGV